MAVLHIERKDKDSDKDSCTSFPKVPNCCGINTKTLEIKLVTTRLGRKPDYKRTDFLIQKPSTAMLKCQLQRVLLKTMSFLYVNRCKKYNWAVFFNFNKQNKCKLRCKLRSTLESTYNKAPFIKLLDVIEQNLLIKSINYLPYLVQYNLEPLLHPLLPYHEDV